MQQLEKTITELKAENARLRTLVMLAGIPLEAMRSSVTWELCPSIKEAIVDVTDRIRALHTGEPHHAVWCPTCKPDGSCDKHSTSAVAPEGAPHD